MARVWIFQDPKQVQKHGTETASWYCGWIDPDGKQRCKSCGPFGRGKNNAEKLRKKLEAELLTGTYEDRTRRTWAQFLQEYTKTVLDVMAAPTRLSTQIAIDHFEKLIAPQRMRAIKTLTVAQYVAARKGENGAKPGTKVSPATINKELRHLRAIFRKAKKWKYISEVPEFEFLREPEKLPTYVTPDHFAALYLACSKATLPDDLPYPAADWWRGLLVTAYMTGWRIGSILALRREDVDLDAGTAISRSEDNKGARDQLIPLHATVIQHLRRLPSFGPTFFPWNVGRRLLWDEFQAIQTEAEVSPARKKWYGFHDLRRAFATMNADRLTADALQHLMQHRDYQTTKRYIDIGRQLSPAVQNLFVPEMKTKADKATNRKA
jgi:integrase